MFVAEINFPASVGETSQSKKQLTFKLGAANQIRNKTQENEL